MASLKVIGRGKIATIYTDGTYAFKTYPESFPTAWIHYEYQTHQAVFEHTDLPLIRYKYLDGQRQIQMDYIQGKTLADRMRKDKYKQGLEDFVQLQILIFKHSVPTLNDAFKVFESQIKQAHLNPELQEKALQSLNKIEFKQQLCHLDFHLENILFDGQKYIIIDWVNAKQGNPVMDIARSYIIFKQYAQRLANKYLRLICNAMSIEKADVYKAIPLMAFLRLLENDTDPFRHTLVSYILEENHA